MTAPIPTVDVSSLVAGGRDRARVAREIDAACREQGFFSIVGHGLDPILLRRLLELSRGFFALTEAEKGEIAMARGGRAWRGWFPVGGELTSGVADRKEGVYFGAELRADDPRVRAGLPLHGPNLFPRRPTGFRDVVLSSLRAFSRLGQDLMGGVALGLGLPERYFADGLTAEPVVLLRAFHYPPMPHGDDGWGVAEHTDYGLLTILLQDATGGLEVRTSDGWSAVQPIDGTLVCNLGDMLERITDGRYRATPHRVRSSATEGRIACPFFFDPGWDTEVLPLPLAGSPPAGHTPRRWDGTDLRDLRGTYGEYLTAKVSKVFPALSDDVL